MRLASVLVLLALSLPAAAQLVESIEVRVTNVEVVVTDSRGRAIHGLTREDFELFEDGKRQPITNFYEVRTERGSVSETAALPVADENVVRQEEQKRRIVIFVDNGTLHPSRRTEVLRSVTRAIERLMRGQDEAMVVTWDRRVRILQPFTSDLSAVRAAVERAGQSQGGLTHFSERRRVLANVNTLRNEASRGFMGMGAAHREALSIARVYADSLEASLRQMLASLRHVAATFGGMEGRKIMILVSGDLPQRPGYDLIEQVNSMFGSRTETILEELGRDVGLEVEKVIQSAAGSNIALYTIDAGERRTGIAESGDISEEIAEFAAEAETASTMGRLADATGGRSLSRTRNYDVLLEGLAADLHSYYSIGYRSTASKGSKNLRVAVRREGLRVRSRKVVVHKSTEEQIEDQAVANLFRARSEGDFQVTVTTGASEVDRRSVRVPVTVSFPSGLTYLNDGGDFVGEFAVYIVVATADGALSPVVSAVQPVRFPKTAAAQVIAKPFTYTTTLVIARGDQTISVAVIDRVGGGIGYGKATVGARRSP